MKCSVCHCDLPPDWPKYNDIGDTVCVPCQRDLEILAGQRVRRGPGPMTPIREVRTNGEISQRYTDAQSDGPSASRDDMAVTGQGGNG